MKTYLKLNFPELCFFSESPDFTYENSVFWNNVHDFSTTRKCTGTNLMPNFSLASKDQIYTVLESSAIVHFLLSKETFSKIMKITPFFCKTELLKINITKPRFLCFLSYMYFLTLYFWQFLSKNGDFYLNSIKKRRQLWPESKQKTEKKNQKSKIEIKLLLYSFIIDCKN